MTAAERLKLLSGATGAAAALLLSIGVGATTGEALNAYSSIEAGTAAEHLLSNKTSLGVGTEKSDKSGFSELDDEQHFAKQMEYISKIYSPPTINEHVIVVPVAEPEVLVPVSDQITPDLEPGIVPQYEIDQAHKMAADHAIEKAIQQRIDDEQALILILSQII